MFITVRRAPQLVARRANPAEIAIGDAFDQTAMHDELLAAISATEARVAHAFAVAFAGSMVGT